MMHSPLQRYPEFCRKLLYEGASPEFLEATSEWEKAYGKVGSTWCPYVDVRLPIDNRTFNEEAEISRRLGRESLCCFSSSWPVRVEAWCLES